MCPAPSLRFDGPAFPKYTVLIRDNPTARRTEAPRPGLWGEMLTMSTPLGGLFVWGSAQKAPPQAGQAGILGGFSEPLRPPPGPRLIVRDTKNDGDPAETSWAGGQPLYAALSYSNLPPFPQAPPSPNTLLLALETVTGLLGPGLGSRCPFQSHAAFRPVCFPRRRPQDCFLRGQCYLAGILVPPKGRGHWRC